MTPFKPQDTQSNSTDTTEACGLFGKIPQQGDFISHFLPSSFTEHWHNWLQACMGVSKEQLADDWLNFYLTSPVWRFSLMPSISHPRGVAGVVLPSVDEVGRYFPLTLVQIIDHAPWSAFLHGNTWFDALENIALFALEENVSYSDLIGELESLPTLELPSFSHYQTEHSQHSYGANMAIEITEKNQGQQLPVDLLHIAYTKMYSNYSLWWTEGSELLPPTALVNSGLPDAGQYAAMLDGKWAQWGWNIESLLSEVK